MTQPTQLVISEQAREAAESILNELRKNEKEVTTLTSIYLAFDNPLIVLQEQTQLLLNSQREAIIRECAEVVRTHAQDHLTVQPSFTKITEAILAKLQNK